MVNSSHTIKESIVKNKIFITALFLSLALHLFWLTAVKVVIIPGKTEAIRFSRVSFLGPILQKGPLEVSVEPKKRTFLEKRYIGKMKEVSFTMDLEKRTGGQRLLEEEPYLVMNDLTLSDNVSGVISGVKIEPDFVVE